MNKVQRKDQLSGVVVGGGRGAGKGYGLAGLKKKKIVTGCTKKSCDFSSHLALYTYIAVHLTSVRQ